MFRFLKSIRTKLTLWYSFVVLLILVAFGLVTYAYTSQQLAENLDRSLSNEVKWVNNFIKPKVDKVKPSRKFAAKNKPASTVEIQPPQRDETDVGEADDEIWTQIYHHALINPKKTMIVVTDTSGKEVFRSTVSDENFVIGEVPANTISMNTLRGGLGQELRVAATSIGNLRIYVAYPLAELTEVLDNLFKIFLVFIPISLAISIVGGWFLAYKSLAPVDEVTRTARRITAENLDQQIPRRMVDDELGRLVSTFNNMIGRLNDSFNKTKQFTMDASHELRTPLTIMRGEMEIALRNPKEPEEYRRILSSNLEEILRLSAIIDNLLTLSKADQGQYEMLFEPTNLKELMAELYEDCEILASKKEIAIECSNEEDLSVMGDKIRLRQMFLNLIENAIKFTPNEGKISLALERQNGFAKVQVKDTGIGIPLEEQSKIFDRFYRIDKARSRELGGSGLGLSIVKWIVDLHEGHIEVESEPNLGSTFSVYLPL